MLKQIKELKYKSKSVFKQNSPFKPKYYKKKNNRQDNIRKLLRCRKVFKHRTSLLNPTFKKIALKESLKPFSTIIFIKIRPNNIFCTLINTARNKTLYVTSSGKCKIKTSKKLLRFSSKLITQLFFEKIRKALRKQSLLVNIVGPKKIRRIVVDQILTYVKNKHFMINVDEKKCFNGCRAPKKKRKKQKTLRVFK